MIYALFVISVMCIFAGSHFSPKTKSGAPSVLITFGVIFSLTFGVLSVYWRGCAQTVKLFNELYGTSFTTEDAFWASSAFNEAVSEARKRAINDEKISSAIKGALEMVK